MHQPVASKCPDHCRLPSDHWIRPPDSKVDPANGSGVYSKWKLLVTSVWLRFEPTWEAESIIDRTDAELESLK